MELWIARDKDGSLCLSRVELVKAYTTFICNEQQYYYIDDDLFPEVTFENSPKKVELKLVEK